MNEQKEKQDARPSRRNFIAPAAAAGAVAAAFLKPGPAMAAPVPAISIPKEVAGRMEEAAKVGSFEGRGMSGAEVFAKLCKEEDLAAMFCCPGNYTVINAIAAAGVPTYGGRTPGAMCAAAARVSRATRQRDPPSPPPRPPLPPTRTNNPFPDAPLPPPPV